MHGRLILLGVYFFIVPFFILGLILYQSFLYHQDSKNSTKVLGMSTTGVDYYSLPNDIQDTRTALKGREARIEVLKEFFGRYDSPLEPYAENIVDAADKYGLDYRLLPAIAMQESTLCLKAPEGLNNCWGFGIYGKKKTGFSDYGEAIEVVSKTISEDYHGIGLVEPEQIMTKYTPSSNGSWAESVSYVMNRIEQSL